MKKIAAEAGFEHVLKKKEVYARLSTSSISVTHSGLWVSFVMLLHYPTCKPIAPGLVSWRQTIASSELKKLNITTDSH